MERYIPKSVLVAEIERLKNTSLEYGYNTMQKVLADSGKDISLGQLQSFINNLKVIDPYEQCIQYASIEAGIKAHAEDYSWNIDSELFQQLTPEQQKLWRKEIEQAVISGGYSGLNLAKDPRYKENLEVKEVEEEPVRGDFEMALAEMIDKAQKCVVEPWVVAAQWKDELVKLAKECKAMQEHPKDCMYSKDNYTDEDRKILCEGCEEECRFNKED